jgi:ribose 5-phosphate isomerase B
MKVYIASDHAGFSRKQELISSMKNMEFVDLGPGSDDRVDYPDFANKVCEKVLSEGTPGILICGSGQGMAMRANKFKGIRAALCWSTEVAQLSRQHNDANILCLGARLIDLKATEDIVQAFFNTAFEGGRHQGRVEKISSPI